MGLKKIGETLPPGFKFNPSDEELVCHYLYKKIANEEVVKGTLVEIDLHTCEPWQLPEVAKLNANEWYFFSFRDRKYATGYRTNRATTSGYWKATGKDRVILDPKTREIVGMRKTLVFYQNRAPNGLKTPWIMHEFRMETPRMPPKEDWVLCRVFHKSKGETNTQDNLHIFEFDNLKGAGTTTTSNHSSPPTMATCKCQRSDSFPLNPSTQIQTLTQTPNVVDPTLLNPSTRLLQLLEEGNTPTYTMTSSSRIIINDGHDPVHEADQYEFLWDMDMDMDDAGLANGAHHGHHHQHHHSGLIGDLGFEDGNGIVLL